MGRADARAVDSVTCFVLGGWGRWVGHHGQTGDSVGGSDDVCAAVSQWAAHSLRDGHGLVAQSLVWVDQTDLVAFGGYLSLLMHERSD